MEDRREGAGGERMEGEGGRNGKGRVEGERRKDEAGRCRMEGVGRWEDGGWRKMMDEEGARRAGGRWEEGGRWRREECTPSYFLSSYLLSSLPPPSPLLARSPRSLSFFALRAPSLPIFLPFTPHAALFLSLPLAAGSPPQLQVGRLRL